MGLGVRMEKYTILKEESVNHKLLEGMPLKLKSFYLDLHNGFFFYPSRMMGIVSLD